MMKKLAILASGAGSNTQKIIDYFRGNEMIEIALILTNKSGAGVLNIAAKEGIESVLMDKAVYKKDGYALFLTQKRIDFVILAGFLLKIPRSLIIAFPGKIINIHPALLPKFGGIGMYGHHVHEAVINNKEKESGITIHYVDEQYDHGATIFQTKCIVSPNDTPESLADKIHALEHRHFPQVIEKLVNGTL